MPEPDVSKKLAEHTPSFDYAFQASQRRIMQLLGANKEFIDTVAPLPYKSQYPYSNKVLDALITVQLDPTVKPLSLKKGALDKLPILKKLSSELADRGYFRKYPGGAVGVGGGGGSAGDSGDAGPGSSGSPGADEANQPGPDPADPDPANPPPSSLPPGYDPDAHTSMTITHAADPADPTSPSPAIGTGPGSGPGFGEQGNAIKGTMASTPTPGDFGKIGPGSALGVIGNIAGMVAPALGPAGAALAPFGMAINAARSQSQRLGLELGLDPGLAEGLLGQRSAENPTGPPSATNPSGPSTPPGWPVSPPPLLPPGSLTDKGNPPGPNPNESPGTPGGDTPGGPPGGSGGGGATEPAGPTPKPPAPGDTGSKNVVAHMLGGSAPDFLEVLKSLQY